MTVSLIALSAAVWFSGGGRGRVGDTTHRRGRPGSARPDTRRIAALPIVAGLAMTVACVVAAGLITGTLIAAALAPLTGLWVRRLQARQQAGPPREELAWIPLVIDLVGAALLAGQPLSLALEGAVPPELPGLAAQLRPVSALLRLGAEPEEAWRPLATDPRLRTLAATAIRSASSGIKLAAGLGELASELRADARGMAQARAQRAGVWVIAPLGLCFLPAFVCLGIVPVVIGIAASVRAGTPL